MIKKHAISLFDSKTLKDIPFILGKVAKVEKLYILSSYKEWMEEDLNEISRRFNTKIEFVQIYDSNNFFEVYLMLEKICEEDGFPSWINITNGSGMALSALTLHSYFKDAPLVILERERNTVLITNVNKLKKIKIYKNRYFELIKILDKKNMTTSELALIFRISFSSMSRRLKHLDSLGIVTKSGLGRVNFPFVFQLTEFGRRLL